jgi:hypothetical protein
MGKPPSLVITCALRVMAASWSLHVSCGFLPLSFPPWDEAQAWAKRQSTAVMIGGACSLNRPAHGLWGTRGGDSSVTSSSSRVAAMPTSPPVPAARNLEVAPNVNVRHVPT